MNHSLELLKALVVDWYNYEDIPETRFGKRFSFFFFIIIFYFTLTPNVLVEISS